MFQHHPLLKIKISLQQSCFSSSLQTDDRRNKTDLIFNLDSFKTSLEVLTFGFEQLARHRFALVHNSS